MKSKLMKIFGGLLLLLFLNCTKEKNCTVTKVLEINETRIDSIYVQKEYVVTLECY